MKDEEKERMWMKGKVNKCSNPSFKKEEFLLMNKLILIGKKGSKMRYEISFVDIQFDYSLISYYAIAN